MEIIYLITALVIGVTLGFLINALLIKSKNIAKADYNALAEKFNEATTAQKVAEDRFNTLQQDHSKISTKLEAKETELNRTQAKVSSLETTVQNNEQKIAEANKTSADLNKTSLLLQEELNTAKQTVAEKTAQFNAANESLTTEKLNIEKQAKLIAQLTENINTLTGENSKLTANNEALTEKLATQKEEIIEIQKKAHLQFEKIASEILEEKSGKFTEANKKNIESLLKPLGENIETFRKKVEEVYNAEAKERFSLGEKVRELVEQTNKVSEEANNLATALKGNSKKQGNWGEVILESILQKSGLVKDREYFVQPTIKDDEGKSLRPDVLVHLPDNRVVIVDSKVSLNAYDKFSAAETQEEQTIHLADHVKSIKSHVDDLSGKKYDNLETSLDFTMMFVPIEPAYLVAIQNEHDLWAYAYSKRILIISPTNLIACLKLIADLWKREMQSKNAQEIVKRGEAMYEKFIGFAESMEDIGKHIVKTQTAYDNAIKQLNTGSGNLVGQAQKLKNLGLKSNKEIPPGLISPLESEGLDSLKAPDQ